MAWEPSLGAFFGPVAFIVLVTCVYFTCTFIQLRRHPEKKYELKKLTEEQQRLAAVDAPHCHQGAEPPPGGQCPAGCPGIPINPALLANEHSFKAQLRTAAFTLFLFLATWTFGALAVSQGHFLDMIFSCLYGAFSVTLGLFILIHHCAKRDDVWHCWCSCCPGRREEAQAPPQGPARPKVNVNGDTTGHIQCHGHCPHDAACKALLSCRCTRLQTHASCGTAGGPCCPAATGGPCCSALHTQQLLDQEPEGPRPVLQLHPCLKSSRTKSRTLSQREYAYHISSRGDTGSAHSSHTDSPHSTHERHVCPHLHEAHHACHAACHNPCHRHICCAKAELLPSLCPPQAELLPSLCPPQAELLPSLCPSQADAGVFLCGCGRAPEDEAHHHLEMIAPRRQSFPQNPPNQNGILKGGLHEGLLYSSDSTGNIRTGPWKNETTV